MNCSAERIEVIERWSALLRKIKMSIQRKTADSSELPIFSKVLISLKSVVSYTGLGCISVLLLAVCPVYRREILKQFRGKKI